jgi:hypothetical protein
VALGQHMGDADSTATGGWMIGGGLQMAVDLGTIRRVINPPSRITSFEHLEALIHSPDCHTVVEEKFYDDLVAIFAELRSRRVAGDIVAAGVWKGGSALYLQALNKHFELNRRIWLSDTFSGFLEDRITHEKDREALRVFSRELRFSSDFPTPGDVERLFRSCDLWDDRVTILEGPLESTLRAITSQSLCLVHIDVDFYQPTRAVLELCYEALSPGGYVIVDDYGVEMFNCRDAVDEFRAERGITEPLQRMTEYIAYWRKGGHV